MKKLSLRLSLMGIALMLFSVNPALADDGDIILHETFDDANSIGGNDGTWRDIATSVAYSKTDWAFVKGNKGDRCVRLATGSAKGSLQTPSLSFENGKTYTLIFRAGAWQGDATSLAVSYGETSLVSSLALTQSAFKIYTYTINATGANYIKIETTGKKRCFVDDIMIVEGAMVNVTIAPSGWSSLATPVGLDFSGVDGLTAFIATAAGSVSGVTLTSVDEAAGAEGVMLKGTAGTKYSIPIKAAATTSGTNLLSAAYSATPADANELYILSGGKLCLVDTGGSNVPAGKAYLLASNVDGSANELTFNLEEEGNVTGIKSIETSKKNNGVYYDMSGRSISNPTKGLYIVNGKKVIIK